MLSNDQARSPSGPFDSDVEPPATYLATVAGSAGALPDLCNLIAAWPEHLPMAIIAIVHSGNTSYLGEVLQKSTRMPVQCASTGDILRAGCVYVAPGGAHLAVNPDITLTVSNAPHVRQLFKPSADWLFESAAASFGERHVAIVLGGALFDGARMLRAIKRTRGKILVQDPATCLFDAMPLAAIQTGLADDILPVLQMPPLIEKILKRRDWDRDRGRWFSPFAQPMLLRPESS